MTVRELKELIIRTSENLDKEYKSAPGKPWLTLAGVTILLTFLGMYYLWVYFDSYHMIGFAEWDINDAYTLLFNNLMPMIYLALILSFFLLILIPGIIKNKRRGAISNDSNEIQIVVDSAGLSNMAIIIIVLLIHVGLYVLLQVYNFGLIATCIFLGGTALASYLYLQVSPKVGVALAVLMAFFYANIRANKDVQLNEKIRPRFNVTLSGYSKAPIVNEDNSCRYIIYNTANFYYIKDNCQKKIYAFSISGNQWKSMSVKK